MIRHLLRVEATQSKPQEGKALEFFISIKPEHVTEQEFPPKELNYLTVVNNTRGRIKKKKKESAFIMLSLKQFLRTQ